MLTQLVKDCMLFGLNEYESLFYIEKRTGGRKISRSNFYNIKKRISENEKEVVQERLVHDWENRRLVKTLRDTRSLSIHKKS